jgi:hypothetical protein
MRFFVQDHNRNRSFRALRAVSEQGLTAGRQYEQFLKSIAEKLPEETRSFVMAPWYRNP